MDYKELISELETLIESDLLTLNQIKDVKSTITVLRSHQVLSEGKDGDKLKRIVAKLREEKEKNLADNAVETTRYRQGYIIGLSKAVSIVLGDM